MRIYMLGGSPSRFDRGGIGPISAFVETDSGVNILVDHGIGYRRHWGGFDEAVTPLPLGDRRVDYVVGTHIHNDHLGMFLWIMKKHPKAEGIMTLPTFVLGKAVWSDLHSVAMRKGYPGLAPYDSPLYEEVRRRMILTAEPGWVDLKGGVRLYLNSNGHTRGSAYVLVEADQKRVVFSGDVSLYDMPTIRGMSRANVPSEVTRPDILFLESTHGDRDVGSRVSAVQAMNHAVVETLRQGGMSVATALGVERSQDVAIDQVVGGVVYFEDPKSRVYLDGGLSSEVWRIYQSEEGYWSPNDVPIDPVVSERIVSLSDRGEKFRVKMVESKKPLSIISSSGSLQGGPSVFWAKHILPDPKNLLLQCNYQFEGTPGAELERLGRGNTLRLDGDQVPVSARVLRIDISAHAGANQLAQVVKWFEPNRVALYHGTWSARRALQRRLDREGLEGRAEILINGEDIVV